MKRSEFVAGFKVPHVDTVARAIFLAEKAGVTWDPEEPEGFEAWWESEPRISGSWVLREHCLAAWNACLSRQEAQERTIETKVDPEVRRKEIEAQIEAWADFQASIVPTGMTPMRDLWAAAGRCLIRNCLRGGVL